MFSNTTLFFCFNKSTDWPEVYFWKCPNCETPNPKWKFDISKEGPLYTLKDSDGLHDKYGKQMTICDLSGATQKHLWTELKNGEYTSSKEVTNRPIVKVQFFCFNDKKKNFIYRLDKVKRISKSFNFCPWFFGRYEI